MRTTKRMTTLPKIIPILLGGIPFSWRRWRVSVSTWLKKIPIRKSAAIKKAAPFHICLLYHCPNPGKMADNKTGILLWMNRACFIFYSLWISCLPCQEASWFFEKTCLASAPLRTTIGLGPHKKGPIGITEGAFQGWMVFTWEYLHELHKLIFGLFHHFQGNRRGASFLG